MVSSKTPITNLILLAHGSPDPRSAAQMEKFADEIANRLGIPTFSAYLEHNAPTLHEVAAKIQDSNALVVPMLLSNAFHARFDVPKAANESGLHNVLPPIGHPAEVLNTLFIRADTPVMVVAAGTSNSEAQSEFEIAVQLAGEVAGVTADHAYVTGQKDLLAAKFAEFAKTGGGTVIPWLFAEGKLMDQIHIAAAAQNLIVEGDGLCHEAVFIEYMARVISTRAFAS